MMTIADMKRTTGMVLSVWFPESAPAGEIEATLSPALADVQSFVRPENVVVVVDGGARVLDAVRRVQSRAGGFEILFKDTNEGKGGAVLSGLERLMTNPSVEFILARDHDNDHLANDGLNLVNLTRKMQQSLSTGNVVGIGRRANIHRHLGFVRGEYETTINEVVFEAAKFSVAQHGGALNTQFFSAYEPTPDMQSGFKCYTRATAQFYVEALTGAARLTPGLDLLRTGAEIPVIVETLIRGGAVGECMRLACERPPLTTFNQAGRVEVKGTVLAWALRRTDVPGAVARQLLTNAIARRTLAQDAAGLSDLLSLANWALEKLSAYRAEHIQPIEKIDLPEYF